MYCIIYLFCTRRSYKQFMWIFLVNLQLIPQDYLFFFLDSIQQFFNLFSNYGELAIYNLQHILFNLISLLYPK